MPAPTGYLSRTYAEAFAAVGTPRWLPRAEGWLVERRVPGMEASDAMGCYPLLCCRRWDALATDLAELTPQVIAVSGVVDPLGEHDVEGLQAAFLDLCFPFKEHFVVDLKQPLFAGLPSNHKRNAKQALKQVEVRLCKDPLASLDRWCELYGALVERHEITGLAAFSRTSFAQQLATPGLVAFEALVEHNVVGMLLWYIQEDHAYYHLAAYSETGYDKRASFGLFRRSIEHFAAAGLRSLCLGAGAGLDPNADDGLTRFKRGWSTHTRTAWFGGRVLNPERYAQITRATGKEGERFFPAYRAGEFG